VVGAALDAIGVGAGAKVGIEALQTRKLVKTMDSATDQFRATQSSVDAAGGTDELVTASVNVLRSTGSDDIVQAFNDAIDAGQSAEDAIETASRSIRGSTYVPRRTDWEDAGFSTEIQDAVNDVPLGGVNPNELQPSGLVGVGPHPTRTRYDTLEEIDAGNTRDLQEEIRRGNFTGTNDEMRMEVIRRNTQHGVPQEYYTERLDRIVNAPTTYQNLHTTPIPAAQGTLNKIQYQNFNINQLDLLNPGESAIVRTFTRNDKSQSQVLFKMENKGQIGDDIIQQIEMADAKTKSYFNYNIKTNPQGETYITGIHFFSGGGSAGRISSARLAIDFVNQAPKKSILIAGPVEHNTLTMDSLTFILGMLHKSTRGKISRLYPKGTQVGKVMATAESSVYSKASKLGEVGDVKGLEELFAAHQKKLIAEGRMDPNDAIEFNIVERRRIGVNPAAPDIVTAEVEYTPFKIEDFKAFAPMVLGFKDWEELEQAVNDIDDTVEAVIDLEKGIF